MKTKKNRVITPDVLAAILASLGVEVEGKITKTQRGATRRSRTVETDEDEEDDEPVTRRRRTVRTEKRSAKKKANDFIESRMAWHAQKAKEFSQENPEGVIALKRLIKKFPTGDEIPAANEKQVAKWDRAVEHKSWHTLWNMVIIRPAMAKYLRGIEVEV